MHDFITQAVSEAFDLDAFGEALADVVADLIDYDEIARDLSRRQSLRDAVHDAALSMAEDLL